MHIYILCIVIIIFIIKTGLPVLLQVKWFKTTHIYMYIHVHTLTAILSEVVISKGTLTTFAIINSIKTITISSILKQNDKILRKKLFKIHIFYIYQQRE